MHIISESFLSIANANKIASIKKCIDNDGHISTEMIEQLLLLHISTKKGVVFIKNSIMIFSEWWEMLILYWI